MCEIMQTIQTKFLSSPKSFDDKVNNDFEKLLEEKIFILVDFLYKKVKCLEHRQLWTNPKKRERE